MNITRIDVNKKWSRAVIHNGVTYFCGQVAEQTDVGLAEQTQSALERLDALLRQVGSDRTKLLTVTIYLTALPQIITAIVAASPQIIDGIVTAVLNAIPQIVQAGIDLLIALIEALPQIISTIVQAIPQIIAAIVKGFASGASQMASIGLNLIKGIWNGISDAASWLWSKVSGFCSNLMSKIKGFFGIHSPSKEMAWIGEMLTEGLAGGIDESAKVAVNAAQSLNEGIMDVMDSFADDMQTAVPSSFNLDADATVRSAASGVLGKAASDFTIAMNITNFNNYSSEDIRQLTNKVMETASQFAQRKGVVFA